MAIGSTHARYLTAAMAVFAVAATACDSDGTRALRARPTQGAVSSAVQRMTRVVATAIDPHAVDPAARSGLESAQLPAIRVDGEGVSARLQLREDAAHQSPTSVRVSDGWALSWGDAAHTRAMFARVDESGRAVLEPVVVREARSDEEDVVAPSMAFNGTEFGVAWVDPANGRVNFARVNANGSIAARPTIVHEGLEMPTASRVVWTGSEFGVAVAMHAGVYFARVNGAGQRIGDGTLVADGALVAGLDDLSVSASGFSIAWHDAEEGGARHNAHLSRAGQLQDQGSSHRSAGARVALR